jgi:hypothetical protein
MNVTESAVKCAKTMLLVGKPSFTTLFLVSQSIKVRKVELENSRKCTSQLHYILYALIATAVFVHVSDVAIVDCIVKVYEKPQAHQKIDVNYQFRVPVRTRQNIYIWSEYDDVIFGPWRALQKVQYSM